MVKEKPSKDLLRIDRNRLEEVCEEHPQLAFVWGEKLAEARRKRSQAENRLKLCQAETAFEIRSNPGEYGLEKITEDAVKMTILLQQDYQISQQEVVDLQAEEDELFAFVMALNARKEMISDLAKLHGQMFWSKPDVKSQDQESRNHTMRDVGSKVRGSKRREE